MVKIVDANASDYWQNVRDNASRRRALEIVKTRFAKMHVSQIYEQYLEHCLYEVEQAAIKIGFIQNHVLYEQYKGECAVVMGLPEIADCSSEEICSSSAEAVREAQDLLYGKPYC